MKKSPKRIIYKKKTKSPIKKKISSPKLHSKIDIPNDIILYEIIKSLSKKHKQKLCETGKYKNICKLINK